MDQGSLLSPRYDPAEERAWHLSILTGQGITACAVHSVDDGRAVALFWGEGKTLLNSEDLPRHPVTISFVSLPEWSTLVPLGALEPGTGAEHLALVHGGLPSGALREEPVRSIGATCIYVHDDREESAVLQKFPNARALPLQGLMVRSAKALGADRQVILVLREAERVHITIVDNGKLLMSNSFSARSAHDVLYFTLMALERTGISPMEVELRYGGSYLSDSDRDLLGRYVNDSVPGCSFELETTTEQIPVYRWMAALEQFSCVS